MGGVRGGVAGTFGPMSRAHVESGLLEIVALGFFRL
jgi:hypothetical protein